ncbi:MAG TPA: hypothetical protein EYQ50_07005 [Verrucomicrobiales bacterium]|nr:hypothetical protein [Verrucomicrobiales bacterium]HIL68291.1 hypothetical protein [Verrucomicrobiota bacterium]
MKRITHHKTLMIALTVVFAVQLNVWSQVPPQVATRKADAIKDEAKSIEVKSFEFRGGSLSKFLRKINEHFGVDLHKEATINVSLNQGIPKMRLSPKLSRPKLPGEGKSEVFKRAPHLGEVLTVYNTISDKADSKMGNWIWSDGWIINVPEYQGLSKNSPDFLILVGETGQESSEEFINKVRVFVIKERDFNKIQSQVSYTSRSLWKMEGRHEEHIAILDGELGFHKDSELLIAIGIPAFIDVVDEIVKGFEVIRANRDKRF